MQFLALLAQVFAAAFASLRPRPSPVVRQTRAQIPQTDPMEAEIRRLLAALENLMQQWRSGTLPAVKARARKANRRSRVAAPRRLPPRQPFPNRPELILPACRRPPPTTPHLRRTKTPRFQPQRTPIMFRKQNE